MKKIMLATAAVLGLTFANAQTNTTTITTSANSKTSHRPTVEVRAERSATRLKQELKLNEEQFKKVYETKLAAYTKIEEINHRHRTSQNSETHKAEKEAVHTSFMQNMKEILTAEQHAQWEKSNSERYEKWKTAATSQPQAPKPDLESAKMRIEME